MLKQSDAAAIYPRLGAEVLTAVNSMEGNGYERCIIDQDRVILLYPINLYMKIVILAVFATLAHFTWAGETQSNNPTHQYYNDSLLVQMADARQMLSEIMDIVGLQPNFELKEAKVLNIEASVSHRKRYILYNAGYINWISETTKDRWAAMALLAHEIGHHLNGHTIRRSGSKPKLELEADEFAGFVLQKLGASLEQSQEVMKHIAGTRGSRTHPGRDARMQAIQRGWNRAAQTNSGMASKK